jgi:hypothetical protein
MRAGDPGAERDGCKRWTAKRSRCRGHGVAAVLAINRLCAPGSELAIEERWYYPSTALDDLLEIEEGKINDTRLYRCLDRILIPGPSSRSSPRSFHVGAGQVEQQHIEFGSE